jgi:hypothetical protein
MMLNSMLSTASIVLLWVKTVNGLPPPCSPTHPPQWEDRAHSPERATGLALGDELDAGQVLQVCILRPERRPVGASGR